MEWLDNSFFPASLLILLFAASLTKSLSLKKENKLLSLQLDKTTSSLSLTKSQLGKLQDHRQASKNFQTRLDKAELVENLQEPYMRLQQTGKSSNAPERYRYIHSLMEKGLSAEEIGSVLMISTYEARQLVTLSEIAAPH